MLRESKITKSLTKTNSLFKKNHLNPGNNFPELQKTEKHVIRHHGVAFNKIQTVRNSTGVIRWKPKNLIRKFFTSYRMTPLLPQHFTRFQNHEFTNVLQSTAEIMKALTELRNYYSSTMVSNVRSVTINLATTRVIIISGKRHQRTLNTMDESLMRNGLFT